MHSNLMSDIDGSFARKLGIWNLMPAKRSAQTQSLVRPPRSSVYARSKHFQARSLSLARTNAAANLRRRPSAAASASCAFCAL